MKNRSIIILICVSSAAALIGNAVHSQLLPIDVSLTWDVDIDAPNFTIYEPSSPPIPTIEGGFGDGAPRSMSLDFGGLADGYDASGITNGFMHVDATGRLTIDRDSFGGHVDTSIIGSGYNASSLIQGTFDFILTVDSEVTVAGNLFAGANSNVGSEANLPDWVIAASVARGRNNTRPNPESTVVPLVDVFDSPIATAGETVGITNDFISLTGGEAVILPAGVYNFKYSALALSEEGPGGRSAGSTVDLDFFVNPLDSPLPPIEDFILAGDFNSNSIVDQGDLNLVLNNWGSTIAPDGFSLLQTSLFDGLIDQNEYNAVLLNWGDTLTFPSSSGSSSIVSIPEPAVLSPVFALMFMFRRSSMIRKHID
ncbi:MAG: hypothetical protein AAF333_06460 [Planctomycetota bacterium]